MLASIAQPARISVSKKDSVEVYSPPKKSHSPPEKSHNSFEESHRSLKASHGPPEEFQSPPEDWQVIPHASVAESNRPGFIVVGVASIIDATHDLLEILFGRPYYGN